MIIEKDDNGLSVSKCKDCIFATWEQDKPWHKTQTGCKFNRIEKFKNRNTDVDWVDGDSVSSYQIHFFCNNIRDTEWLNARKCTLKSAELIVRKDNTIQWTAILYTYEYNINDIKNTIISLVSSKNKPKKIIISAFIESGFVELISQVKSIETDIPIVFSRIIDNKYPKYLIDYAVVNIQTQYYLAIKSGQILKNDFVDYADSLINDECNLITEVHNKDHTISLINTLIHNELGGNIELCSDGNVITEISDKLIALNPNYKNTIKQYE